MTGEARQASAPTPVGAPRAAEATTRRAAATAVLTALACCAFYSLDRTYNAIWHPGPDPAQVMASVRIEYFWRLIAAGYLAPVFAAAAWWGARGREARALRIATVSVGPIVVICAILSVVWP